MSCIIPVSSFSNHLILHIGPPKTGSSSLQRVLNKRRKELLDMNICSPDIPSKERNKFALSICENPSLLHFEPRSIVSQKIIISAESMASSVSNGSIFNLIRHCSDSNLIHKIDIVYVKKPFQRVAFSEFNQRIFRAASQSIDPLIKQWTIDLISEFVCTGYLRRRSQLEIVEKILISNNSLVVLDLKNRKDVNRLFFLKYLKLNPKLLRLPRLYANESQTQERESLVLEFINNVLTQISPMSELERKRLDIAHACLNSTNASYQLFLNTLQRDNFEYEINEEEKQYETLIKRTAANLKIF